MAWLGLLATVVWNYSRHLRGLSTICSLTRLIPRPVFLVLYPAGALALFKHVHNGYRPRS